MSLVIDYPALDLEALLAPLDVASPAGWFDEEDETFQGIDHEMVKLGGLHEPRLDWSYVDEASRQYLASQCKHFRVAGHLIAARLRAGSWRTWAEAAHVLAGMVERYWEAGFPKPGPTGFLVKRRFVALQVERLGAALGGLRAQDDARQHQEFASKALDALQAQAAAAKLDVAMLARLEAQFARRVEQFRYPEPAAVAPALGQQGGQAISEAFFNVPGEALKQGDERESRRSLLSVADFINQQDAYDPAGYQLRRFALWAHLHAAPPVRKEMRTELMAVPNDIAHGYGEALTANTVTPALLQRVEKSVVASPYWIRGSFLAASIARRLEMKEVASAIRSATERFVRRIPVLVDLQFNDGRPFVDAETLGWLSGADAENAAQPATLEFRVLREELSAQLASDGVEAVLRRLQELQGEDATPRQRGHARVIAAEMLAVRGLSWLAQDLYAGVGRLMQDTPASQWEPELFGPLSQYVPARSGAEEPQR
ncbi:type VI secretion system protein TssA [Achromobacter sp. 77]|uniref:type VI secretion system protein TssA n=1 Tax=Achromobacter sp. 77 TaxID=2756133 RepID=UPI001D003640|nr:type VI secretion system protein TssA [Achromobacter sp. 77]UDG76736.1 type VI secretion system protein TssA [Achromobacter sp. 77]